MNIEYGMSYVGVQQKAQNKICSFTDLHAWQHGHNLVLDIYQITKQFPHEEQFGLTNQLRRAAVSITSNIAEGFRRQGPKEKAQFYRTALGSLTEVQNQLLIAKDVKYIDQASFQDIAYRSVRVAKLLNGLIKKAKTVSV